MFGNPMAPFEEGETVESQCNACGNKRAPIQLRAMMVNQKDHPQNRVPAIVVLASKQPPDIVTEKGVERNPKFNPLDVCPVATWEIVEELCNDKACFDAVMDRLWRLAQQRIRVLWGR
jgi:hypothetical protein